MNDEQRPLAPYTEEELMNTPYTGRDAVHAVVLTNSECLAWVDAIDYEAVSKHSWHLDDRGYVARNVSVGEHGLPHKTGRHVQQKLHVFLLGKELGHGTDHRDGNLLNCRRNNLRFATQSQNNANNRKKSRVAGTAGTSRYKGVCWNRRRNKWHAQIQVYGNKIHLGLFVDEVDAAHAYDTAALKYFGEFARPNFL